MMLKRRESRLSPAKKKAGRVKKIFWLISFLLLLLTSFYLFNYTDYFLIKHINIIPQNINCINVANLNSELVEKGYNFFLINRSEIKSDLQKKFICLSNLNLNKKFPDQVKLSLYGREAIAMLSPLPEEASISAFIPLPYESSGSSSISTPSALLNISEEKYLVDKEGVIFEKLSGEKNLPVIYLTSNISLGKKIAEGQVLNTLEVIEKLRSFNILLKDLRMVGQNNLFVNSTPYLIFNLEKDIKIQLASLQLILNKAKINEESIEFVDLRFDKPIIRVKEKKK